MFEEEPDPQRDATDDSLLASPLDWGSYSADEKLRAPKGAVFETRLEVSGLLRALGNERFQEKDLEGALVAYRRAFWHVDFDLGYVQIEMSDEHMRDVFEAQAPCRLNAARCLLKRGDISDAKHEAEAVLELCKLCESLDPQWKRKALHLRAKAYVDSQRYDDAEKDINDAIAIDDTNDRSLTAVLKDIKQHRHELKKQQKQIYGSKLADWSHTNEKEPRRTWCLLS